MTPGEVARGVMLEAERLLREVQDHPRWAEATRRRPVLLGRLELAKGEVGRLSADFGSSISPPPDALERAVAAHEALERLLADVEAGGAR